MNHVNPDNILTYEVEGMVKRIKEGALLGGWATSVGKQKERIVDTVSNMEDRENLPFKTAEDMLSKVRNDHNKSVND